MKIYKRKTPAELGKAAGEEAALAIQSAIKNQGEANIILATGTSQFETIKGLLAHQEIDWKKVRMFHLDEYLGLDITHPASFRKYLKERFVEKVAPLKAFHFIDGEKDPIKETERLGELIRKNPIDVALVGIGENGHLAFNDPPADFDTEEPYLVVDLDEACRKQQFNEGWFPDLNAVPTRAISMSIRQIMKSKKIICSVPDSRKAAAVKSCLENEPSPDFPASILQEHPDCSLYLDEASASLLDSSTAVNE
ncbi:glucosamine-6-phosphate deaminase [Cyclobacterium salsum]|uniref:glucosamine-6-phosphate deaminase n=1 Tax=Cyclobacterium salsum TaxID=2666329 RepID=UPI0013913165|nr:glucosamine-6-phosphate deaminase [Cyclobacterium salsum]